MKDTILNSTSILLVALIFIFSSCDKNTCESTVVGENFTLSDSIKTYLSNYENTEKIYFITDLGNEVSFNVSEFQDFKNEYQINGICEDDIAMHQTVKGSSQIIQLYLSNPSEIPEPIYISLSEIPSPPNNSNVKEGLLVSLGEFF